MKSLSMPVEAVCSSSPTGSIFYWTRRIKSGKNHILTKDQCSRDKILHTICPAGYWFEGFDGWDCGGAEYIWAHKFHPFVFQAVFSDEETPARAKSTGPRGYLVKPFENGNLRAAIEVAIREQPTPYFCIARSLNLGGIFSIA
jgi:CheY-like chemotaxis protein